MRRALRLAAKGFTPPNPMVGCVLVRDGAIVGEGYHHAAGHPHAEANALAAAGDRAAGATAYVTLEPCSHWGRTPPCADALIRARVARVVCASSDPNPKVAGSGLDRLRAAGIPAETGVLEADAIRLNEAFFHFHATSLPFVTIKVAATLDGKIATRTGDSRWVTGEPARRHAHRIRAQSGAVMVGIGTLLADDPRLTARLRPSSPRQPLRIVVDSALRTPPGASAVAEARARPEEPPLLIATTDRADSARAAALEGAGVEIARLPSTAEGRVDLVVLMRQLAEREIISVLCEGGGEMNAALLAAGLAHKALVFLAPKIVGGRDAPTAVEGAGAEWMGEATPVAGMRVRRIGGDLLVEGRIYPKVEPAPSSR